jgi:hypothetical protein
MEMSQEADFHFLIINTCHGLKKEKLKSLCTVSHIPATTRLAIVGGGSVWVKCGETMYTFTEIQRLLKSGIDTKVAVPGASELGNLLHKCVSSSMLKRDQNRVRSRLLVSALTNIHQKNSVKMTFNYVQSYT